MQEVCGDEHLWVRWSAERLPDHEGQLQQSEEWEAERRLDAELDNYGFHRAERLPGDVGYLDIRFLHRPACAGDTAASAMRFVANTRALIIDLRSCTGGYPGMVVLILSYLFGEEPVHLSSIYWRDDDITQQYWTMPYVPGKRFGDKPVFVLTSRDTFSGGEALAHHLQAHGRATVVGEKTDGGAHPGAHYRLNPHFEAFIPIGRAIDPVSGEDWEGKGVIPDVPAGREQALEVAYGLALQSVIEGIGELRSGALADLLGEARAILDNLKGGG
jgi:C-terminal processing protease CtpA/Prc